MSATLAVLFRHGVAERIHILQLDEGLALSHPNRTSIVGL